MPRADTKHLGTQFYHSQFTNSQYLDSSSASPPLSPVSQPLSSSNTSSTSSGAGTKKKHVCGTCDRAFTTSGHLARHSRVHTGERNHKCPFPGCETRCSRQDNLQQHYRIHLSPGSRRSSTRSGSSRGSSSSKKTANPPAQSEPPSAPPPLSSPPALEPARIYSHHSTPPDSPPPLAQATLPATATLPLTNSRMDAASDRSSSSGSPQASYASPNQHLVPMSSQSMGMSGANPQNYSYRSGTTTYQEQSQGAGAAFTYVHTTPVSHSNNNSNGNSNGNSFSSYSNSHDNFAGNHSMHHQSNQNRGHSPVSMSSRHSISHISHPQSSYSQNQSSSAGPASPASSHSVSSHTSGPPTPTYPVFHDDGQTYHHGGGMIADHSGLHNGHINSQSHIIHQGYSSNVQSAGRFDSPPPILAPIQDERFIRRDDRHVQSHNNSPYIHHPQPLPTEYPYHQSLGLGHGAWKGDGGMRRGVGTALV
ncbi:hypothetical protein GALMADRAFT_262763 [Galerina marginata CBS 339.88]|uniref:C2H2-type domain-containing protein n=1 Tax=Galerina marginata (strain CBS 339.88) TaxID=685588 RepID=A0A067TN22_GALM3|nr:hypothetical protein GALMADRAFT_262763 [Galerina marginata CBS 339.88]